MSRLLEDTQDDDGKSSSATEEDLGGFLSSAGISYETSVRKWGYEMDFTVKMSKRTVVNIELDGDPYHLVRDTSDWSSRGDYTARNMYRDRVLSSCGISVARILASTWIDATTDKQRAKIIARAVPGLLSGSAKNTSKEFSSSRC